MKKYLFIFISFTAFAQEDSFDKFELELVVSPYDYAPYNEEKSDLSNWGSYYNRYEYLYGRNLFARFNYYLTSNFALSGGIGFGVHHSTLRSYNDAVFQWDENGYQYKSHNYNIRTAKLNFHVGVLGKLVSTDWFDLTANTTIGLDQTLGHRKLGTHSYVIYDLSTTDPENNGIYYTDELEEYVPTANTNLVYGFGLKSRFYIMNQFYISLGGEMVFGKVVIPYNASSTADFKEAFRTDIRLQGGLGFRF